MRASVLLVCVLVAAAIACPTQKKRQCPKSQKPATIPITWQIEKFDSKYYSLACSGVWHLQMNTPTQIKGACPLKTSLFYTAFPGGCNRVMFYDDNPNDYSYYMLDSSYNYLTQTIDTTQSVFTSAYPNSDLAIFNVNTQPTYKSVITERNPFSDKNLQKYSLDSYYQRGFTTCIIGADDDYIEYMVLIVVNEYENIFSGSDKHLMWMFTRAKSPEYSTYLKAFDDISASGLNPYDMVSVDQSINFEEIPTISKDDILGVVQKTTTKTTKSSTSSSNGCVTSSCKQTTIEETTTVKPSVEIVVNPSYTTPYTYESCSLSGDIKIIRNFSPSEYLEAVTGTYFLNSGAPYKAYSKGQPGILYNVFPYGSPQITIDNTDLKPFSPDSQYMMVYRCYNMMTGEILKRRYIIQCPYYTDGSIPYGAIMVYSEKFTEETYTETTPFSYESINVKIPNDIYTDKYVFGIAGYKRDSFLILYMYNKIPNLFSPNCNTNPLYVFTRERVISKQTCSDIAQELLRSGYPINNLIHMDQTKTINEAFLFERPYFYPTTSSCLMSPKGLSPYPTIIPKSWKLNQFDNQPETVLVQGQWNLQLSTPIGSPDNSPLKTGLWAPGFPCTKNRLFLIDSTPSDDTDYNLEFYFLDTSFNLITQKVERTQGMLKPAYPSTKYAIFNVCTPQLYKNPFLPISPLDDQTQVTYKLNKQYTRQFTVAIIGGDKNYNDYMILAVVNKYNNVFNGCGDVIWVFTRKESVDFDTYNKVIQDITASGMNPDNLMSIDQSIDLTKISTVTPDDINGVIEKSTYKKEELTTTSTNCDGISSCTSSTKKTTIEQSSGPGISTTCINLSPSYNPMYSYCVYKYSGSVKILQNLTPQQTSKMLSGKYYGQMGSPMRCYDGGKIGILNTVLGMSPFVQFEDYNNNDWDFKRQYMMMDGGYNMRTGKLDKTRCIIQSPWTDGSTPYATYIIHSEGYYKQPMKETVEFDYNGFTITSPAPIYNTKYMVSVAAYSEDKFVAFYVLNQFNNQMCNKIKNQMYVMSRNRIMSPEEIQEVSQALAYSGYDLSNLMFLDQTNDMKETIPLDSSYFEIVSQPSSSSCCCSSSVIESSSSCVSVTEECSSSSSSC